MKTRSPHVVRWPLVALFFACSATAAEVKYYGVFSEAPPTSIQPQGWVKQMLHRQVEGLGKHHAVSGYPFDTCLWAGKIPPNPKPIAKVNPKAWWPYEQAGYLVDGLERLGLATGDSEILAEAEANVQYILAHPQDDGSLGPNHIGGTNWPHAVVFRALMASYSAKPREEIPEALRSHYLSRPDNFGVGRDVCNIEAILWTYARTRDDRLLSLARKTYDNFNLAEPKSGLAALASDKKIVEHGVTFNETAKLPALLYLYTGDRTLLDASIHAYRKVDRDHMLASGMHSAQEYLSGKDPWTLTETCDVTDYTWSLGYMLMATGDVAWADRIEKAIFNAGMGAIGKDFKTHQYFSSPNQVIATHGICKAHNPDRAAYRPGFDVECCSGNVHRMLPNFALRQWLVTRDGGVVAALYGPSQFTTIIDGATVTIEQQTDYPFSDVIHFVIHTGKPVEFPLLLRIPQWTSQPTLQVNGKPAAEISQPGSFTTIKRTFSDGDRVTLRLPMQVKVVEWEKHTASIERGPLVYSLKINETIEPIQGEKTSADFPAWDKRPASPWAYAIAVASEDFASQVKVVEKPASGYAWDTQNPPVELQIPGRQIRNWTLSESGGNPGFPETPELSENTEMITLVPYGSTCLRLTVFPTVAPRSEQQR